MNQVVNAKAKVKQIEHFINGLNESAYRVPGPECSSMPRAVADSDSRLMHLPVSWVFARAGGHGAVHMTRHIGFKERNLRLRIRKTCRCMERWKSC